MWSPVVSCHRNQEYAGQLAENEQRSISILTNNAAKRQLSQHLSNAQSGQTAVWTQAAPTHPCPAFAPREEGGWCHQYQGFNRFCVSVIFEILVGIELNYSFF